MDIGSVGMVPINFNCCVGRRSVAIARGEDVAVYIDVYSTWSYYKA
jgi:hypothetical protein